MRALIVAAVSTVTQADADHDSIPSQLRLCREVCAARGWHLAGELTIPGHSRNYNWLHELVRDSPDYAALVGHIESRNMDLIVVRDFDRLWRTDALRAQVTALCREHRVQVYAVNQPVEPTDPERLHLSSDANLIMEALSGVISESENRTRTRRMMMGRRARVERRGLTSYALHTTPYGYIYHADGPITPDPLTAPVVRRIYTLRAVDRLGYRRIAALLVADGIPTARGNAPWQPGVICALLRNPVYMGTAAWGGAVNANGQHEAIVDADLWHAAQAATALLRDTRPHATDRPRYALTGLVRCAACGSAMTHSHTRPDGRPKALRCGRYLRTGARECHSNWHSAAAVEDYVLSQAERMLSDPDLWRAARADAHGPDSAGELVEIAAALAELDRRWAQWSHAYEIGAISLDEMLLHRERIRGERQRHTDHRQAIQDTAGRRDALDAAYAEAQPLAHRLRELPPLGLRRVYTALIAHVRLERGRDPAIRWL